jgi:predicted phage baseplate assembly protein
MGLPTRNLDDRTFQQIVDEAKKRIAATCPSWTDHNVSDPGVTLVELFAWMTEMILYRLNQVPEKNYIKFMELLGLKLREPEPARTEITFYLSSPQPQKLTIPKGVEAATVRTENNPSVIFSTDEDALVDPPLLNALITTRAADSPEAKAPAPQDHNLQHLGVAGFDLSVFGNPTRIGDALYLGFENDLSNHVVGLEVSCLTATGLGIDPANPPWAWEGWHGGEGEQRWLPAVVEEDSTGGMNQTGLIRLRLPQLALRDFAKRRAYWVRCRVTEPAVQGTNYDKSPRISNLAVSSWGVSVWGTHASLVHNEILGRSDGSPGQVFSVEHTPMLRRLKGEAIETRAPGSDYWEPWVEVSDFADSGFQDKHFTCDSTSGEIRFGPALRQPDGSVWSYGAIPARGAEIRFSVYRYGGGVAGNVQAGTLAVLKTSIPYIDRVTNHVDATGGIDAETIERAQLRAPQLLRSRGRAVTAADYEALTEQLADSRVQRSRCIQPAAGGSNEGPLAGQIYVLLVPKVNRPEGRISSEQLRIPEDLRASVKAYLDDYRLLTVRVDIREPEYLWVAVEVSISASPSADPQRVRQDVEKQLYRYLNPITGGPAGNGWPFGRDLYPSDVYTCLQPVRGIEFIESLHLYAVRSATERSEITGRFPLPIHGLIASGEHRVDVH